MSEKRKHKMGRRLRIPKTPELKLFDIDAYLFLLREHWQGLRENASHLKAVSAELRALICFSSDTEGLLWRLADELGVDDNIFLHVPGKLKRDHPLAKGLALHTSDLHLVQNNVKHIDFVEKQFLLTYERLLSSKDSQGLYDLPPNGYSLWKYSDEFEKQGVFPE